MALQQFHRHIKLTPRRVQRKSAQQTSEGVRYARRSGGGPGVAIGENLGGESK